MVDEKQSAREEKLKQSTADAIDTLGTAVKETSRKIFNAAVEHSAEVFSDVFDKCMEKAKEKIKKGEEKDEQRSG